MTVEGLDRLTRLSNLIKDAENELSSAYDDFKQSVESVVEDIREALRKTELYSDEFTEEYEKISEDLTDFLDQIENECDLNWDIDFCDVSFDPEELIKNEVALKLKWSTKGKTYDDVRAAIMRIFPYEAGWDGSVEIEEIDPEDF